MTDSPSFRIKCDVQHKNRAFNIFVSCGDTPRVRAYLYENGQRWYPDEGWTAELGFGTSFEFSESLVVVDGVSGYDLDASSSSSDSEDLVDNDYNFFQFDFTSEEVGTPGDYYCQLIVRNEMDTERFTFGYGTIHILKSPLGGSYTDLVLKKIVNWDIIENIGTVPWPESTEVIECSNCGSGTTICSLNDAGKTWVWSGDCDQIFILPTPTASTLGSVYQFSNLTLHKITIRPPTGYKVDGYDGFYTGQGGFNDNPARTFVRIKQTSDNGYQVLDGRLKWTYEQF